MRYQTTHLKNSVIQARKAANAAKRSADAYEETVRLTERADVLMNLPRFPSQKKTRSGRMLV
jgi:hypothetical protein